MKVYLAGCMSYYYNQKKSHLAEDWRNHVKNTLHCEVFDPTINYKTNVTYEPRGVVYQNIHYLKNCDIILVNLDDLEKSQGTIFEIFYGFLNQKPVIAFGETEIYNQPHIKESITMKFNSIHGAIQYIHSMYCQ